MAAWFLFFLIGLVQFGIHAAFIKKRPGFRFAAYVVGGTLAGCLIVLLPVRIPTPEFHLPMLTIPLTGALSGVLIGVAERFRLFNRPLLQFFITPALGLVLAFTSSFLVRAYLWVSGKETWTRTQLFPVGLTFLLIGFMTVFGYTFPRRWFRKWVD
jgi:hypothetical protein